MFQQLPVVIFGIVTISFGTFFSLANVKLMRYHTSVAVSNKAVSS